MTPDRRPGIEYTLWDAKTHTQIWSDLQEGPRTATLQRASDDLHAVHGELLDLVHEAIRLVQLTRRTAGPGFAAAVGQFTTILEWLMETARKVGATREIYETYAERFEDLRNRLEPPRRTDAHATQMAWMHTDSEVRDMAAREAAQRAGEQMVESERSTDALARSIPWFDPPPGRAQPVTAESPSPVAALGRWAARACSRPRRRRRRSRFPWRASNNLQNLTRLIPLWVLSRYGTKCLVTCRHR